MPVSDREKLSQRERGEEVVKELMMHKVTFGGDSVQNEILFGGGGQQKYASMLTALGSEFYEASINLNFGKDNEVFVS